MLPLTTWIIWRQMRKILNYELKRTWKEANNTTGAPETPNGF